MIPHVALKCLSLHTFAANLNKAVRVNYSSLIRFLLFVSILGTTITLSAQHDDHDHTEAVDHHDADHDHSEHGSHAVDKDSHGHHSGPSCVPHDDHHADFDPKETALHHISDANVYTILDAVRIPLPVIVRSNDAGWDFFSSGKFDAGHHDDGHYAYNGYVLHMGAIKRVVDTGFPMEGKHEVGPFSKVEAGGKETAYVCYNNKPYLLEAKSTLDGGLLGGGMTGFMDFSITKNVMSMILVSLLLFFLFRAVANAYKRNEGKAPSGIQSWIEPIITYIRDEVAIPFIGEHKYQKYFPLLLSIFFFILGLNLWGQVPFLGGTNVTGNLNVTMVIAIIVFLLVTFIGNKHYWEHILWMPGVPTFVKPLVSLIEIMSMFIKPLTLMLRLAGNISAGHIAILSFVGLIFIFGDSGRSMGGSIIGAVMSTALTLFMMSIELIVAFIQAYVFTLLSASYIGAAVEDHEHH